MKKSDFKLFSFLLHHATWVAASIVIGSISGVLGSAFHIILELMTKAREHTPSFIYFLPIAGLAIVFFYLVVHQGNNHGTDDIMDAVKGGHQITWLFIPLIFISTMLTHLFGGSAGREGAALQMGGSLGSVLGKSVKLKQEHMRTAILCGMSCMFTALFGTPIAATIFTIEFISVGILHYSAVFPCLIGSLVSMCISTSVFHIKPTSFSITEVPEINIRNTVLCIILSVLCAVISILFCHVMHGTSTLAKKIKNPFARVFIGGVVVVLLTLLVGNHDYNGAGIDVIERAIAGEAAPAAFILKIIFTAITIGFGYKGGEIVPSFFIGATFGCVVGGLLGLPPSFAAALGLIGVFCGVTNAPIASVFLAAELFGSGGFIYFGICSFLCFILSGHIGLYESQRHLFTKDGSHSSIKASSKNEYYID